MAIDPGTRLGPYEIRELLGAGGMGEVYRARDGRLDRDVAIKVLSPHLTSRPDVLERFEREAKVVASLSHPNIVAIFDVGHDGTHRYVVTELLEGRTLREQIAGDDSPDWRGALRITYDVAKGLAAAHAKGITHRDIKPENIFLTEHGPKILDFGLARLDESIQEMNKSDATLVKTPSGYVLGTVGYMSPEQTAGDDTGPPSDVFSLGCVLYELLAGVRPFTRKTAAETMHAILREQPRPLPTIDSSVQDDLESVVTKCLEKEIEHRFGNGEEVASALDALQRGDHESLSRQLPAIRKRGRETLAVLDLENPAGDGSLALVATIMAEELQNRLANDTDLNIVARSRVRKLGEHPDPDEAAKSLEASLVIAGSARRASGSILVQLELIDAERGAQLWGGRERIPDDTETSLAWAVNSFAEGLRPHLPFRTLSSMETKVETVSHPELSSETIELLGTVRAELARGNESGYQRAIDLLERAVSSEPDFALGHAKLAEARLSEALDGFLATSGIREKAIAEAVRAEALYDSDETKLVRVRVGAFLEWKWKAGVESLAGLGESAEVSISAAELLVCLGKKDEAVVRAKQAVSVDTLSPEIGARAARVLYLGRRWVDAQEQAHRTLIQSDSSVSARIVLAMSLARQGMFESGHEELQDLSRQSLDHPEIDVALGELYALWEKNAGAAKIIRKLDHPPRPRFVPLTMTARIESSLGRTDAALERLESALAEREVHLAFLRVDPAWDAIRGQERFRAIEERVFEMEN